MASYNKVILVGNLTRDPQLSYLPSNTPVCEFGLAVNRRWRGQDGEQRESVCFVDCRIYRKAAETFNQYMSKGQAALVEGHLDFQQWETSDGQKRSKHMVIVQNFQFLGGGRGGDGGSGGGGRGGESYGGDRGRESYGGASRGEPPAAAERPASPSPVNDAPPPPADSEIPF